VAAIDRLRKHSSEIVRAAAVSARARLGGLPSVADSATDKSWRVRQSVAEASTLAAKNDDPPPSEAIALAAALLRDASLEVQKQSLASITAWPPSSSGPLLLEVLADGGYQMRKDARRQLAASWEPASRFAYDGPSEDRARTIAELKGLWVEEFGPIEQFAVEASAGATAPARLSDSDRAALPDLLGELADPRQSDAVRRDAVERLIADGPALLPRWSCLSPKIHNRCRQSSIKKCCRR